MVGCVWLCFVLISCWVDYVFDFDFAVLNEFVVLRISVYYDVGFGLCILIC